MTEKHCAQKIFVNNVTCGVPGGWESAFGSTHKVYNLPKGKDAPLDFSDVQCVFQLRHYQIVNPNRCLLEIQML